MYMKRRHERGSKGCVGILDESVSNLDALFSHAAETLQGKLIGIHTKVFQILN